MANDELPSFQSLKKGTDSTEMGKNAETVLQRLQGRKSFVCNLLRELFWLEKATIFLSE